MTIAFLTSVMFILPRRRIIPGEGLKPLKPLQFLRVLEEAPKKNNPWRGIETEHDPIGADSTPGPPKKNNPWRGIETWFDDSDGCFYQKAPKKNNPWRGIETEQEKGRNSNYLSPKKNNPWRGIETKWETEWFLLNPIPPKKNNPWRGIETNRFLQV